MPLTEPDDQGVTLVGYPLEIVRVADSVYLDQARHNFPAYIHRTLAASQAFGGRYNRAGEFGAIYTASDEETAWREVAARYAREGIDGLPPTMGLVGIVVRAGRYVDLSDNEVRRAWDANDSALRSAKPTPAQAEHCWDLGRAIRAVADFLVAPSARGPGSNVPLFPDRESGELDYDLQFVKRGRVPDDLEQRPTEEW